jgi:Flp pilus assembly protein TadG
MPPRRLRRRAIASVELAVLLPLLALLLVLAIDWSRIFYYSVTIENCARNGAIYASDPYTKVQSPYKDITEAALADAPNLQPPPEVQSASGVDGSGHAYVDCTVSYKFYTVTNFPAVPQTTTLVRTVRVYQAAKLPQ